MLDFIVHCFDWLPVPLRLLVGGVISFFVVMILIEIIKVLFKLFQFLKDVFGGLISKVVAFFG